mmetsp:Transcript_30840/g.66088  ORF Transcript_30840/g.66088 Transcript_30840/m.66088 type:complete len:217 (+) Transcript_30840:174-824(+)
MGQCCACLRGILSSSGIEMSSSIHNNLQAEVLAVDVSAQQHSIDPEMSAPSIEITNDSSSQISGHGLALVDTTVEQDQAYWEWKVHVRGETGSKVPMFGVSNKRNSKFYEILADSSIPEEKHGTKFMCAVPGLEDGDVIGVVVQQSELPMIQLYKNGEIQDGFLVSRFRGTVYPSVYLPQSPGNGFSATFLYTEKQFIHGSPSPTITPLIAERSLM